MSQKPFSMLPLFLKKYGTRYELKEPKGLSYFRHNLVAEKEWNETLNRHYYPFQVPMFSAAYIREYIRYNFEGADEELIYRTWKRELIRDTYWEEGFL